MGTSVALIYGKDKPRIRDYDLVITGLRNKKYAESKLNSYVIDYPL